jgi:hypothetical protein
MGAYDKGRADRAEDKSKSPGDWNPLWHTDKEIAKIEKEKFEYREGYADKDREIKKEK